MSKAQELRDAVNAALGKDTVRLASDPRYVTKYVSTGLLPFDILMQGGIPKGRMCMISGDYSTLKSYVGLKSIEQFQRRGMTCAVIDTEHAFDASWAEQNGVNLEDLIVERPETGELAIDIMETLVRGGVDLIVLDSIAALAPQAETNKRLHNESIQPARLAQLMSAALRRLTAANKDTSILWINQTRQNIGITFGPSEVLTGGRAMPYYSSLSITVKKAGKVTRDVNTYTGEKWQKTKELIGQRFRAEITKSRLSKPFREIWFLWSLEDGAVDLVDFLVAQGLELGFVTQKGNSWSYGKVKAVGREKFINAMRNNPDAQLDLEAMIREHHGLDAPVRPKRTTTKKSLKKLKK